MAADEVITSVSLDFDAKRDRWIGYDSADHMELIQEWEMVEEARKKVREARVKEKMMRGELDELEELEEDEDKYAEDR